MNGKVIVVAGQHAGQRFAFSETPILLGSDEACAIRLLDAGVCPRHAAIERMPDDGWRLRADDAQAVIGSRGRAVTDLRLEPGTVFQLGGA